MIAKKTTLRSDERRDIMNSYRQHLPDLMQQDGFYEFALGVLDRLARMKPGSSVPLATKDPDRLEWLLVAAAAFMNSNDNRMDYYVSDDYSRILRSP